MAAYYKSRIHEYDDLGEKDWSIDCLQARFKQSVRNNPMLTDFGLFGLGLGIGALFGCYLASHGHCKPPPSFATRMRSSLSEALPDTIGRHFRG